MDLSFAEVREILGMIERIDCASVTIEYGDVSISVQRAGASGSAAGASGGAAATTTSAGRSTVEPETVPEPASSSLEDNVGRAAAAAASASSASPAAPSPATPAHWVPVTAPMIGTFYRSGAPEEPPFVEVGNPVRAGQTIGLIEVMKLFSDLKADVDGTVTRVDAVNGQLVEYDQPLLWIEPA